MSSQGAIYVVSFPQKRPPWTHLLKSNRSHIMIQTLAKGKVFQSCHMNHSTRGLLKPSQEVHALILKLWSYKIVSLPTFLLWFQCDCRTHFNNLVFQLVYCNTASALNRNSKFWLVLFFGKVTYIEGNMSKRKFIPLYSKRGVLWDVRK